MLSGSPSPSCRKVSEEEPGKDTMHGPSYIEECTKLPLK